MIEHTHQKTGRKLVIVERKLVRNRGHHHTQIGALQKLLPSHQLYLVTGEDYDGFLGEAAARTSTHFSDLSRLYWRIRHGSARQKADALIRATISGNFLSLPRSPFGLELLKVCADLRLEADDLVIIPSADLGALESVCHFVERNNGETPHVVLRFLDPELGEHNQMRRKKRLEKTAHVLSDSNNLALFCETEEMSSHLSQQYGLDVQGGFYLPCSFDPADRVLQPERTNAATFRVGLFGSPRPGKGYERIEGIVACLERRAQTRPPAKPIEILLQGSSSEFEGCGAYAFARSRAGTDANVRIVSLSDKLSPEEFAENFLSADAILLPYETSIYGLQGSGIIQDAVAAEKFIIHTKGISMQSFLSHGNAVAANSDDEFAIAILRFAENAGMLTENFADARNYFVQLIGNWLSP
ncbi:glycosyltransferase family 4 protein [Rhodobacterales bacterium]|nr:glycosyltransferase family 4 protein [Rhodobacterales bacterium]